jgi:hypothetical protein
MARTIRTKIYKFNELSNEAKQTAIERYLQDENFDWISDNAGNTLNDFCRIFDINLREFDFLENYRSRYTFNLEDNILELSGQRLATYIWNNYKTRIFKGKYYGKLVDTFKDGTKIPVSKLHPVGLRHVTRYSKVIIEHSCVLTGWCYDEYILQPIYDFLDKPTDTNFKDLLENCLTEICNSVENEIKANSQEDAISENFEANNYEFTADGRRF